MAQSIPFDAYLGASKTGLAIGATIYQLDGSTVATAFATTGFYEAPAGSGGWHHAGLSLPDAGGVIAVGISATEYQRVGIEAAKPLASDYTAARAIKLDNLDATISSRMATFTYTAPPTVVEIDTQLSTTHGAGTWVDTGTGASAADVWTYVTRTLTALGSPSGVIFTYAVTNSVTSDPIADVAVWFATDSAVSNIVWYGSTDAFGIARDASGNKPRLDVGVYFILCRKTGFSFPVDSETVSA